MFNKLILRALRADVHDVLQITNIDVDVVISIVHCA